MNIGHVLKKKKIHVIWAFSASLHWWAFWHHFYRNIDGFKSQFSRTMLKKDFYIHESFECLRKNTDITFLCVKTSLKNSEDQRETKLPLVKHRHKDLKNKSKLVSLWSALFLKLVFMRNERNVCLFFLGRSIRTEFFHVKIPRPCDRNFFEKKWISRVFLCSNWVTLKCSPIIYWMRVRRPTLKPKPIKISRCDGFEKVILSDPYKSNISGFVAWLISHYRDPSISYSFRRLGAIVNKA